MLYRQERPSRAVARPDLPQGRAKKIQIQLLLADFSLQFFDPVLCRGQIRRDLD